MGPRRITLPDRRQISYLDGGDAAGYPVIGLHGTPGCRLNRLPEIASTFGWLRTGDLPRRCP